MSPDDIKAKADKAEGLKPAISETSAGRPPTYKPTFAKQAEKLCGLGATDLDLADFFEVHIRTISKWKVEHSEFGQALKVGKSEADDRVEHSLYQKATGYTFDSEKVFLKRDGEIVRAATREHVPPDTVAMIFWLKNRRPQAWRDVQKHEHGHAGDFDNMSADELRASITRDLEAAGGKDGAATLTGKPGQANGAGRPH